MAGADAGSLVQPLQQAIRRRAQLRRSRAEFPRGTVTVTGPETVAPRLYLAEATSGGFAVTPS